MAKRESRAVAMKSRRGRWINEAKENPMVINSISSLNDVQQCATTVSAGCHETSIQPSMEEE